MNIHITKACAGTLFLALVLFAGFISANAVRADGAGRFLEIADGEQEELDITGDLTLEVWIQLASQPSGGEYAIVSKSAGDVNDGGYELWYAPAGGGNYKFLFFVSPDGNTASECMVKRTLDVGAWHHVAVVYSATDGSCGILVNGEYAGGNNGLHHRVHNSGASFKVGARGQTPNMFFDGLIDEVRVWSVARSDEDIQAFYQQELAGDEEGLVGYWQLNSELVDEHAKDETAHQNHLALRESPEFSEDVPFGSDGILVHLPQAAWHAISKVATSPAKPAPFAQSGNTHSIDFR